jgi:hypothetical protein
VGSLKAAHNILFVCNLKIALPVPASPLVLIMAAPSAILLKASPKFLAPQTKGTFAS